MEEFSRDLERLGVKLPAVYDMEWREDEGVWFGTCVSQPILPSPVTLAKKYRKEKADRQGGMTDEGVGVRPAFSAR